MCKPPCRLGSIFAVEKSLPDFYFWFFFCNFSAEKQQKKSEQKIGTKIGTPSRGSAVWVCKLIPCVLASGLWFSDKSQRNEQLPKFCLCCASVFRIAPARLTHISPWLQWISLSKKNFEIKIGGKSGLQLAFTNNCLKRRQKTRPWPFLCNDFLEEPQGQFRGGGSEGVRPEGI